MTEDMKSYFVRHTNTLAIDEKTMNEIWNKDKFFIHYPVKDPRTKEEIKTKNPNDYPTRGGKHSMKILLEISINGGYIWSECWTQDDIKIGFVKPNTNIEYIVKKCGNPKYEEDIGKKVILKALPLEVKEIIKPKGLMSFRCARPRQVTISRWPSVKNRLKNLVNKTPIEKNWDNLFYSQQEIACVEYLFNYTGKDKRIPKMEHLLMPPGRTFKDVDIYGIDPKGNELYVQVTYSEKKKVGWKLETLRKYVDKKNRVLLFCNTNEVEEDNGITIIPTGIVENWLTKNKILMDKFF